MKLPPFGKELYSRQQFNIPPFLVIVCDWESAKQWNLRPDVCALVLTPEPDKLIWPVSGCHCIIELGVGPSESFIEDLARILFISGALSVTTLPIDLESPMWRYDREKPPGERWVPNRATIDRYSMEAGNG